MATPSSTTMPSRPTTLAPRSTTPLTIQLPASITIRIPPQPGLDGPFQYDFQGRTEQTSGITNNQGNLQLPAEPGVLSVWVYGNAIAPLTWQITPKNAPPGDTLLDVQLRCNNLGFDCGVVDGLMGKNTRRGISAFQARHHLEVTGKPNDKTLSTLKSEYGC